MHQCVNCHSSLSVAKLRCPSCAISFSGSFELPRLARLAPPQQHLVEHLVLAAGNLKQMAASLEVSYPTLRKRLDELVLALDGLRQSDEARAAALLEDVAAGSTSPESAARLIREMHGAI
ncbi:MAG: DUF2089 domain-containing protein [Gammaproteobacteria bacterium]|nr:DUF2089 domain-containing protein [Gammaproteobacteria bacterium]